MINPLLYAFAGKKFRTQLGEIVDRLILGKNKKREFSNITQITMAAAGNNPLRRNSALWGTLDLTKQWFQILIRVVEEPLLEVLLILKETTQNSCDFTGYNIITLYNQIFNDFKWHRRQKLFLLYFSLYLTDFVYFDYIKKRSNNSKKVLTIPSVSDAFFTCDYKN